MLLLSLSYDDSAVTSEAHSSATIKLWQINETSTGDLVATLGATLSGHTSAISDVKHLLDLLDSPLLTSKPLKRLKMNILASATKEKRIRLWDVENAGAGSASGDGECWRTLDGHEAAVSALKMVRDADAQRLLSASHDRTVRVWNVTSGECLRILRGHTEAVTSLELMWNSIVISGSFDKTIKAIE